MDHRLVAVRTKKKNLARIGSSHNGCATIGILQPSQRDMPKDFVLYATVGEVEAYS
jgi:hypothetical protein